MKQSKNKTAKRARAAVVRDWVIVVTPLLVAAMEATSRIMSPR